ncbi:hypothetical protein BJY04DRAFT_199914 [Aspergillus karnatakaensis]|uniref:uncharacterized protein n=1 Tax=Aspergillus karnatakaensis TaxID=1810916 RepID=UPI003CCE18D5
MLSVPHILPKDLAPAAGPPPPGGSGGGGGSRIPVAKRRRTRLACNSCREKRSRCDGTRPSCLVCISRGRTCIYPEYDGRLRSGLTTRIQELDTKIKELESTISEMQPSSSRSPADHPRSPPVDPLGKRPVRDVRSTLTTTGGQRSGGESREKHALQQYDTAFGWIPTEQITAQAISSFFACIGTIIYVDTREALQALVDNVYHDNNPDAESVCELCAVAAVGCQYDGVEILVSCRDIFFRRALLLLCDSFDNDSRKGIRAIICLVTCLILTNPKSSRALIESGLSSCRRILPPTTTETNQNNDDLQPGRLLQTLITLDSWLSVNLKTWPLPMVDRIQSHPNPAAFEGEGVIRTGVLSAATIQFHFNKIAVLAANVHLRLGDPRFLRWEDMENRSDILDSWRRELPDALQLQVLLTEDNEIEPTNRRFVLMLHMIYLEAQVVFYGRFIHIKPLNELLELAGHARDKYLAFTQQLAHIISVIYKDEGGFIQSWISIHASFHACIALLISQCQCTNSFDHGARMTTNRGYIESCLTVLKYCSEGNAGAARFLFILVPFYEETKDLNDRTIESTRHQTAEPMQLQVMLNHKHPYRRELEELLRRIVQSVRALSGDGEDSGEQERIPGAFGGQRR